MNKVYSFTTSSTMWREPSLVHIRAVLQLQPIYTQDASSAPCAKPKGTWMRSKPQPWLGSTKIEHKRSSCENYHMLYTVGVIWLAMTDSTDCRASCCCGCKEDHVEANTEGGNVAWSCLSRLIILLAVCSVARSLPAHNICIPYKRQITSSK